jgi:hypothetical protein
MILNKKIKNQLERIEIRKQKAREKIRKNENIFAVPSIINAVITKEGKTKFLPSMGTPTIKFIVEGRTKKRE